MRRKRTFISMLLASIMLLSNFATPIKFAAKYINFASATYSPSTEQNYYATETKTEVKVTTTTVEELKKYFSDSSANLSFDAKFVYDQLFENEFADEINTILSNGNSNFAEFLGEFANIKAYFDNEETDKFEQTTFRAFAEYLVLNDVAFGEDKSLHKLFNNDNNFINLSNYYNEIRKLAENDDGIVISAENDENDDTILISYDGISVGSQDVDFYSLSYTYKNLNSILAKTSPVFNYASEGSDNVLAIIANDAPTTLTTYFSNEYETITLAELKEQITNLTRDKNNFYVQETRLLDTVPEELNLFFTFDEKDYENVDQNTKLYFSTFANDSSFSSYFNYELLTDVQSVGYIGGKEVYRKFAISPYEKVNNAFAVYVANDSVTADDQATYDYFGYTAISTEEATSGKYFKIPYSSSRQEFFTEISGIKDNQTNLNKFFETFAPNGSSILYLKYVPYNKVYIEQSVEGSFNSDTTCSFKMLVGNRILESIEPSEAFDQVTELNNYTQYTSSNFQTYFKKKAVAYTTTTINAIDNTYEIEKVGKKYFEQAIIASETLSTDFVAISATATEATSLSLNGKVIPLISMETLSENPNLYSLVPSSLVKSLVYANPEEYSDPTENYKFYQKHQTVYADKLFILDDDVTDIESSVYKTLNYNVITSQNLDDGINEYYKVDGEDENYNEKFELYYRFDQTKNNFAKNKITNEIAVFVVDESIENFSSSEKTTLWGNFITIITADEADSGLYFKFEDDAFEYPQYFRYASTETNRKIYEYTAAETSKYSKFYESDNDFNKNFYVQIKSNDPNYVEGKELFYKLQTKETKTPLAQQISYYGYTTTDNLTLKANSFYVVSYYVNTSGENVKASFYVVDEESKLETVYQENISTNGNWKKQYLFIATGTDDIKNVNLSMYMGNNESIAGNGDTTMIASISGTVLFAGIEITKINQTDFNKTKIDDESIPNDLKDAGKRDIGTTTKKFDFGSGLKLDLLDASTNFDTIALPDFSIYANGTDITNGYVGGYTAHDKIWQYFISRNLESLGNSAEKLIYQKAYENGDLIVSIEEEKTFNIGEKETTDNDGNKTTQEVVYETFNDNNKVLKLENKNTSKALGIVSKDFIIKQNEFYKLTVWIFSDKENSNATITLESMIKTAQKPELGETISKSVSEKAHLADYDSSSQTNEYGWIPVTIYIQGNALHNQVCSLALLADTNSTVFFDNITLEKTTYTEYSSASNQFSLTPATSVLYKGVKNGYFNYVATETATLAENYTAPKKALDWSTSTTFEGVTAGIVATSKDYITNSNGTDFYTTYADSDYPFDKTAETRVQNNIYAIYSNTVGDFKSTNNYSINQKLSLSANTVYEISYEFYIASNFTGNMVANLYFDSIEDNNILETIKANKIELNSLSTGWNKFTFYVATSLTVSPSIYLEIGVTDALGTAFIRNVKLVSIDKTIAELRDELVTANETATKDIYSSTDLFDTKFVDFSEKNFAIHSKDAENGVYESKDYKQTGTTAGTNTIGKTGVVVASYYTSEEEKTYFVTVNKTTYYIFKDSADNKFKLYKFNDKNTETNEEVTEIGGKSVAINQDDLTVTVGKNSGAVDYENEEIINNIYDYKFKNINGYYLINGTIIDVNELENAQSDSVMILANGRETDYTIVEPIYTDSLTASNYYVLKFYVKTSGFEEGKGLSVKIPTIPTWTEDYLIDTTTIASDDEFIDEYGFVCYQVLLNLDSTVSKLAVNFSLGTETNTTSGYAIISSVKLEKFDSEDDFKHYADNLPDDGKIVKKFVSDDETSKTSNSSDNSKTNMNWATFFYIFSSLLLVATTVMAIVAYIFKKHPVKGSVKAENEHDKDFEPFKSAKNENIDQTEEQKAKKPRKKKSSDEGII